MYCSVFVYNRLTERVFPKEQRPNFFFNHFLESLPCHILSFVLKCIFLTFKKQNFSFSYRLRFNRLLINVFSLKKTLDYFSWKFIEFITLTIPDKLSINKRQLTMKYHPYITCYTILITNN